MNPGWRRIALLATLGAALAACGDSPRDPAALLVAPEARAALEVGATLPGLPELVRRASPDGSPAIELVQAEALWREAAGTGDAELAGILRDSAYALAGRPLAVTIDSATLAGVQARLDRWITLAGGVVRHAEFGDLSAALTDAGALLAVARAAQARGDTVAAIVATLHASDRLAETTPQAVAARLSAQDEAALERVRLLAGHPGSSDSRVRLERIDRLVRGAREALTSGHYEVAIRRAWYARQMLIAEGLMAGPAR